MRLWQQYLPPINEPGEAATSPALGLAQERTRPMTDYHNSPAGDQDRQRLCIEDIDDGDPLKLGPDS